MHADYYQNTLYPLQDKVLRIIEKLPVDFYLTGGTALSRAYLHHRFSDDLDFFVNSIRDFKLQVNTIIKELAKSGIGFETTVADEGFARIFIFEGNDSLKLDFVNDIPYRCGKPKKTPLFNKTDNLNNILSNKITALGRYSAKDVVDIVFICENHRFNWEIILNDAAEKDLWVSPINTAEVLEQFPIEKLNEIAWIGQIPKNEWFVGIMDQIIYEILDGCDNSLYNHSS